MKKDSELIEKLREASKATDSWPESMKAMYEIRKKADAYFFEKKKEQ